MTVFYTRAGININHATFFMVTNKKKVTKKKTINIRGKNDRKARFPRLLSPARQVESEKPRGNVIVYVTIFSRQQRARGPTPSAKAAISTLNVLCVRRTAGRARARISRLRYDLRVASIRHQLLYIRYTYTPTLITTITIYSYYRRCW